MAIFVLIPGAGGNGSYWDELVPELERRGHHAVPVDIREDDPALGLPEYADVVERAVAGRTGAVLVAQSMGGFTAPMVAPRVAPSRIVFVNAMVPLPGETPGAWFEATGASQARLDADTAAGRPTDFDVEVHFLHDLPADVRRRQEAGPPPRDPAGTPFGQPCTFERLARRPAARRGRARRPVLPARPAASRRP